MPQPDHETRRRVRRVFKRLLEPARHAHPRPVEIAPLPLHG